MLDGGPATAQSWIEQATKKQIDTVPGGATRYGYFWWMAADAVMTRAHLRPDDPHHPAEKLIVVTNSAWPRLRHGPGRAAAYIAAATQVLH